MDNSKTQTTYGTRHRTKTNKTKKHNKEYRNDGQHEPHKNVYVNILYCFKLIYMAI
jgi:hypothetical protein